MFKVQIGICDDSESHSKKGGYIDFMPDQFFRDPKGNAIAG
jgi:hypothetical protein